MGGLLDNQHRAYGTLGDRLADAAANQTLPEALPTRSDHEQIGGTGFRHVENSASGWAFHDLRVYIVNPLGAQSFGRVAYQGLGVTQRLVQSLAIVGFAQEIGHWRNVWSTVTLAL
jgi:hypothetical protein